MLLAAYNWNIKGLYKIFTRLKAISNMTRGKTPSEMAEFFSVRTKFTPAQEELAEQENVWLHED
ncbi:unnamed protein product [Orchesella dallaii]|uniref:SKP1 component dimerisation domain-containing protein n=1 Tax=Orchesella dallaii TaxID=48710 RepID=A0ABP1RWM8_9HEXA